MKLRVTHILILIMFISYFLSLAIPPNELEKFYFNLNEFLSGSYYNIITALFLHESFIHLVINSMLFYIVGITFEEILGSKKLILTFLFTGIITFLASSIFYSPEARFVGCSGALFSMMAVVLLINPIKYKSTFPLKLIFGEGKEVNVDVKEEKIDLIAILVDYLILTFLIFTIITIYGLIIVTNVGHPGHVIGFIIGSVLGIIWHPKIKEYTSISIFLLSIFSILILLIFLFYLIAHLLDVKAIYAPIDSFLFPIIKFISNALQSFFG
jgi:membrane associated rhomboid family serine protease